MRWEGIQGTVLSAIGWTLQLFAFQMISVSLASIAGAAGFVILFELARRKLHEPFRQREAYAAAAIIAGAAVVSSHPIQLTPAQPSAIQWAAVVLVLALFIVSAEGLARLNLLPFETIRMLSSGVAYALSGLFTKEVSAALFQQNWVVTAVAIFGMAGSALAGYVFEMSSLRRVRSTIVVGTVAATQMVVPVALAPWLFAEVWPATLSGRLLLAVGITLVLVGMTALVRLPTKPTV